MGGFAPGGPPPGLLPIRSIQERKTELKKSVEAMRLVHPTLDRPQFDHRPPTMELATLYDNLGATNGFTDEQREFIQILMSCQSIFLIIFLFHNYFCACGFLCVCTEKFCAAEPQIDLDTILFIFLVQIHFGICVMTKFLVMYIILIKKLKKNSKEKAEKSLSYQKNCFS
jgi:hypothetical protein